ncbi:hypothetical protein RJ492_004615 [Pluralibacter gergoviae]|uniref:Uncharacterized protein n=1 Tax=Pluralibacter gergoviae TaxID=61647 RepID=A0AAI9GMR4_PLUGE|nr:hypothetical protein [Pluralibacter gergoviae]EKV0914421.1 hypothetical protein [Pluralibacter gergoviae]EKV9910183.1 hypothetical protein [Pluralibacter gergoviae]EKW7276848.1 hypothetical protein [Pluralibacter gergoviae]ELD4293370.1 hypothetical protein [Pluralibacter gergoviae]ELD4304148.1 hypothetical protein [Pluralibacter gergoviae]
MHVMAGNGSIFAPFCDKITLPVRVMVQRGGWAWRGQIFNKRIKSAEVSRSKKQRLARK